MVYSTKRSAKTKTEQMTTLDIKTKVGPYTISTVDTWDKGLETMVFNIEESGFLDLDVEHYDTQEEAWEGHAQMVAKWSAKAT